ncbi:MAG: magnesium and cobalt transport protein CorA, partial [Bacteroidetes bacterium]|nr:magnesium and cobalt transport protein CorA [Bacteroidota bacterium]
MERIKRVGLPPGSLIYVGKKFTEPVTFEIIAYNEEFLEEATLESTDDIKQFLNKNYKIWLNVNGLHDAKVVEEIGTLFNIHPLTQEDIMNTEQRPKAEEYDDYLFIALKMLNKHPSRDTFESEHLSLICGNNYVISFQEEKGDNFDVVRERLRKGHRIRKRGVDYLTYVLMDVTIDSYFLVTEKMGEWISHEEIKIIKDPNVKRTFEINQLRHDMSQFRKHIWPVRDVINSIIRYQG